jgi:hypothetical protein
MCVSIDDYATAPQGAIFLRAMLCPAVGRQPASGTGACDMHAVTVGVPYDRLKGLLRCAKCQLSAFRRFYAWVPM